MNGEITIRPMRLQDRAVVIGLIRELNIVEDDLVHDRDTSMEATAACLIHDEKALAEGGGAMIVAEDAGTVIGFMALIFNEAEPYVRVELRPVALIETLVIAATHRRKGLASKLLDEAERLTREAGRTTLLIGHLAANQAAQAIYERFGFQDFSRLMLKRI